MPPGVGYPVNSSLSSTARNVMSAVPPTKPYPFDFLNNFAEKRPGLAAFATSMIPALGLLGYYLASRGRDEDGPYGMSTAGLLGGLGGLAALGINNYRANRKFQQNMASWRQNQQPKPSQQLSSAANNAFGTLLGVPLGVLQGPVIGSTFGAPPISFMNPNLGRSLFG